MITELIIILIFCYVDVAMLDVEKHRQAKLYPSELVRIEILYALKGGKFNALYRLMPVPSSSPLLSFLFSQLAPLVMYQI